MRRLSGVVVMAAASLLLAGCAVGPGEAPRPADPSAQPVDITTDGPGPLLDLDCAGLVDRAALDAAFSPATVEQPLTFDGGGGYYPLSQFGLAQAGALRCEFSDGGASDERYALISVLPDATAAWSSLLPEIVLFQPVAPGYGDDARQSCRDGAYASCRVDVLIGDRWLSAVLGGLSDVDAAGPVIESAVAAVRDAAPLEPAWSPESAAPASCDALMPVAELAAVGPGLAPWERAAPTQPVLFHAGFEQAGGLFCGWRNDFSSASALTVEIAVLPGGAWAWDGHWAGTPSDRVTRERVDGIGDEAWSGCTADIDCWVSVRVGETWLGVTVNDESSPDERERAIQLARTAITNL